MTEQLIQKLEEKVMLLVTELEDSRKELQELRQEVSTLRTEKANHAKKLQALISLMDAVDVSEQQSPVSHGEMSSNRKEELAGTFA